MEPSDSWFSRKYSLSFECEPACIVIAIENVAFQSLYEKLTMQHSLVKRTLTEEKFGVEYFNTPIYDGPWGFDDKVYSLERPDAEGRIIVRAEIPNIRTLDNISEVFALNATLGAIVSVLDDVDTPGNSKHEQLMAFDRFFVGRESHANMFILTLSQTACRWLREKFGRHQPIMQSLERAMKTTDIALWNTKKEREGISAYLQENARLQLNLAHKSAGLNPLEVRQNELTRRFCTFNCNTPPESLTLLAGISKLIELVSIIE